MHPFKWLWWAIFMNDDDGYYGDDKWRAGRPKTFKLAVAWWFRNPFHNFTHYVIGFKGRHHTYVGQDTDRMGWVRGWVLVTLLGVICWFPYRGWNSPKWMAYAGWRPSGAFGFKLRRQPK